MTRTPYALISLFASTTKTWPSEDLQRIRASPSVSSSDSMSQPKYSSIPPV